MVDGNRLSEDWSTGVCAPLEQALVVVFSLEEVSVEFPSRLRIRLTSSHWGWVSLTVRKMRRELMRFHSGASAPNMQPCDVALANIRPARLNTPAA